MHRTLYDTIDLVTAEDVRARAPPELAAAAAVGADEHATMLQRLAFEALERQRYAPRKCSQDTTTRRS